MTGDIALLGLDTLQGDHVDVVFRSELFLKLVV